jgi:hypothetical protein
VCSSCGGRLAQPSRRREPAADRPSDAAQVWRAATAAGRARAAGASPDGGGHRAEELRSDDDPTRLTAARETLLSGSRADVTLLAKLAAGWEHEDQEFVVNVSRTLLGWRPRVVLSALGRHADQALAAEAKEALETVLRQTATERGVKPAAQAESADDEPDSADDEPD